MLETKSIVHKMPEVVPEYLFVQIPEEMKLFDANVGSFESALEQAPEILQPVSVDATINVPFGMVYNGVLEALIAQALIGHERVSVDRASRFDVSGDVSLQSMFATIADNGSTNLTAAFQDSDNGNFVFCASLSDSALTLVGVHEASGTTNESFVYFDFAPRSTHFEERAVLHCKPDAVKHEPCGFLSDAKSAANLVGTDAVLAVGNHPNSDKPLVERERGILKDGSDFDTELLARMLVLALPQAPSRNEAHIFAGASGAHNASGPAALNHERKAIVRVCEVLDGLLECSGLHGLVPQ